MAYTYTFIGSTANQAQARSACVPRFVSIAGAVHTETAGMGSHLMRFRLRAIKHGVFCPRARSRDPERIPPQPRCVCGLRAACSSSAAALGRARATRAPGASGLPGTPRKPSPMAADVPAVTTSSDAESGDDRDPGPHTSWARLCFHASCAARMARGLLLSLRLS